MANQQENEVEEVVQEVTVLPAPAGRPRKKLIIGASLALLLLGGGGFAGYTLLGGGEDAAEASVEEVATFVDVPPLTVNLRAPDGAPRFLRVHLMLVPSSEELAEEITGKLPLIIDAYQPFLRELRPEDLAGSAAAFRLKEEMLVRANATVGPGSVTDVLIQDLVQQ
ncbi:flagellar basal body-associated FliL family protein [Sphingosinicella terrae]|uniref:flagellar basal body-associated FliL family protein n=1 Tax=Sphingosinicella terrae TaxID=2172047 RepID=UPI000E0D9DE3|nr:flagellar basal body-associated FliL family protein [Sphingosinicella terrae]